MADRIKVTDPYSGAELEVAADSPQAKAWLRGEEPKKATRKASTSKSSKK